MKRVLPVIVISQFLCTSVWFAGNSVIANIVTEYHLAPAFLAHLISSVQFGFITGTFLFALFAISDRFSPSKVFFICSLLAAIANVGVTLGHIGIVGLLLSRFLTGFFLAGIYPVGMKIASDHEQKGLGRSLGFLVGALVIGTAFPHLLKILIAGFPWHWVMLATSLFAVTGGTLILSLVPDGPHRHRGQKLKISAFLNGFRNSEFRSIAFGYFGHNWELYSFWTFLPAMLLAYNRLNPGVQLNIPLLSFAVIGSGGLACVVAGKLSLRFRAKKIAFTALATSGVCCLFSPVMLNVNYPVVFIVFLFIWGTTIVADSPLYSTLIAGAAPPESRGTSLTIVNCIGFALTIVSIQTVNALEPLLTTHYVYWVLAIGPAFGLWSMRKEIFDVRNRL